MPLQLVKQGRRLRLEFRPEPSQREIVSRHDRLIDALKTLTEMEQDKPEIGRNPHWRAALNGIAGLLKGGI